MPDIRRPRAPSIDDDPARERPGFRELAERTLVADDPARERPGFRELAERTLVADDPARERPDTARSWHRVGELSTISARTRHDETPLVMLTVMDSEIFRIVDRDSVIASSDHPKLAARLSRLVAAGTLHTLLPGVYTLPANADDFVTRSAAVCRYDRSAVIVGDAAAALSYWSDLKPDRITVAGRQRRFERPGYEFVRRSIPPMLIRQKQGIRYTAPALTALDQVSEHGTEGIDRALRSRRVTVAQMFDALDATRNRRGNVQRRAMLLDSRDNPCSELERLAHRLLRAAGITGWSANVWVDTAVGEFVVDIVFHHLPLCIELDGRKYHGADKFDEDRMRGNELLLAGKDVLRFTWALLVDHPEMAISTVRRALARYGAQPASRIRCAGR